MAFIGFLSSFRPLNAHSGLSLAGNFFLLSFQRIYEVLLIGATAQHTLRGQLVTNQNRFTSQKRKSFLQSYKFHSTRGFLYILPASQHISTVKVAYNY